MPGFFPENFEKELEVSFKQVPPDRMVANYGLFSPSIMYAWVDWAGLQRRADMFLFVREHKEDCRILHSPVAVEVRYQIQDSI